MLHTHALPTKPNDDKDFSPVISHVALHSLTVTPDGFAFDCATGETYTVSSCGRVVLNQLLQGHTQQQLVDFLAEQFAIAHSLAERDVADFLRQLQNLGLIGANP